MPSGTFSHHVVVAAAPDDVWSRLQEADTWSGIGPIDRVWEATHDGEGVISGYRWSATAAGREWKGTARTTSAVPGEHLTLGLKSSEMRGSLTTEIAPNGNGSHLTVTMKVETVGMLSSLFWGVVRSAMEQGLPRQVEDFGARFS
jgi:carbon monoxide dehydrogenase subunit G